MRKLVRIQAHQHIVELSQLASNTDQLYGLTEEEIKIVKGVK